MFLEISRKNKCSFFSVLFFSGCCLVFSMRGLAQAPAAAGPPPQLSAGVDLKAEQAETLAKVTALRDAFIGKIHEAGLTCPIAPPTIVVDHIPSFGRYDDESNTLHTSDWYLLNDEEHALFFRLAGPGSDEAAAHRNFENGVHRWVFSHEMGHWWQACRKAIEGRPPYEVEYGANRLALAYWRETSPQFAERTTAMFQGLVTNLPNPVPAGQPVEKYFNDNYQALGPTPSYRWFQSRMIVTASEEKPAPTFAQAVASTK